MYLCKTQRPIEPLTAAGLPAQLLFRLPAPCPGEKKPVVGERSAVPLRLGLPGVVANNLGRPKPTANIHPHPFPKVHQILQAAMERGAINRSVTWRPGLGVKADLQSLWWASRNTHAPRLPPSLQPGLPRPSHTARTHDMTVPGTAPRHSATASTSM